MNSNIKIEPLSELYWNVQYDGHHIGTCTFYRDKASQIWLNGIDVKLRRKGIATFVIQEAIKKFGQVYFGSLQVWEYKESGRNILKDERYLTADGKKFVRALIKKGIIPPNWFREQIP